MFGWGVCWFVLLIGGISFWFVGVFWGCLCGEGIFVIGVFKKNLDDGGYEFVWLYGIDNVLIFLWLIMSVWWSCYFFL